MLIVLFLVTTGLFVGCFYKCRKADDWGDQDVFGTLSIIMGYILVGVIIGVCFTCSKVVDGKFIDREIAMYQKENSSIEKDVSEIVNQYMDHETKTFDMSKVTSSVVLVQMYQELKSSELVKEQITIYNDNNKKIKSLKTKRIRSDKAKFWLYFGG